MFGCVSETEYQKALVENENLKAEIQELRFGIPNLLKDSKKMYELGDFAAAKEKIEMLVQKHPNATETLEAKKMLPAIEEELLWDRIEKSDNLNLVEEYRDNYPKGKYSKKVYSKKKEIITKIDRSAYDIAKSQNTISAFKSYLNDFPKGKHRSKVREKIRVIKKANQKNSYEIAKRKNSSYAWERFLKDYPNHWDKTNIKSKIISLKVDEIMGDRNTGQLPSFSQTNYGYSSTSSVTIENDTGHELTVRYSGPSVKMIVIPRGGTKTTSLSSGSYKIAASAGGLHYGGRESLSGSYSSTYYISTTRY